MAIDYKTELNRLESYIPSESSDYWSPGPGQYHVKALSEIEEAKPFEDDVDQKERAKLSISIDGKEMTWGIAVGKTVASTYGQLINLAANNNGELLYKEFTVVVAGEDRNKRFTVVT